MEQPAETQPVKAAPNSTAEKIIDAAEMVFARKNYEATTLREIARKVGIREPSIYSHFANKEAIYAAVIERALTPFYHEIYRWNHADLTLRDINDIPRRLMELHADHPYSAQILHKEFCKPADQINPKVLQWIHQITDQSQQFMTEIPENERKQIGLNKVIANSIALTNMTLGVFSTQGMQQQLSGKDYRDSDLFEEHIRVITKIFKSLVM